MYILCFIALALQSPLPLAPAVSGVQHTEQLALNLQAGQRVAMCDCLARLVLNLNLEDERSIDYPPSTAFYRALLYSTYPVEGAPENFNAAYKKLLYSVIKNSQDLESEPRDAEPAYEDFFKFLEREYDINMQDLVQIVLKHIEPLEISPEARRELPQGFKDISLEEIEQFELIWKAIQEDADYIKLCQPQDKQ